MEKVGVKKYCWLDEQDLICFRNMSATSDCKWVSSFKEYFDAKNTYNIILFELYRPKAAKSCF